MSDNKKYYYIKLKHNYFEQDNIKILESMPNGYIYSLIIIKLYLKATKYGGQLKMTDSIPYSPENVDILSNVLNHDISHVKEAIRFGVEFDLISIVDTSDMWMTEIQNLIGKSSTEADRIREYRKKVCTDVQQMNNKSTPKKKKELEKELEPNKEKITVPVNLSPVLDSKLKEFIKYRKVIKHPLKTNRSIESLVKKIGSDFKNEEHLIQCIDFTIDNEYQGVRAEYIKYDKVVLKIPKINKKITTHKEVENNNSNFTKFEGVDIMEIIKKSKVN